MLFVNLIGIFFSFENWRNSNIPLFEHFLRSFGIKDNLNQLLEGVDFAEAVVLL